MSARSWTKTRTSVAVGLGLALALVANLSAWQQDLERENLSDLREINVVVEDLPDDVESAGLTRRALLDAAEERSA